MVNSFKDISETTALARLVLTAVVWHLWKERNMRIFAKQCQTKLQRFQQLSQDLYSLIQSCKWKVDSDTVKASLRDDWNLHLCFVFLSNQCICQYTNEASICMCLYVRFHGADLRDVSILFCGHELCKLVAGSLVFILTTHVKMPLRLDVCF